jgi:hypothetical protein
MRFLIGPTRPWLGLVVVLGVVLALFAWIAAAAGTERLRGVVRAAGGVLLVYTLGTAMVTAAGVASTLTLASANGAGDGGPHTLVDALLAIGGLLLGVVAVLGARHDVDRNDVPAALADEAPLVATGDVLEQGDGHDDPLPVPVVTGRAVDVAAVAVALALPVSGLLGLRITSGLLSRGDVTAWVVVANAIAGLMAGGALLGILLTDERADLRGALLAFAVVAVGAGLVVGWPGPFGNELWSAFAVGLTAGLLLVAAPPLLKRAFPAERPWLATGACLALALVVLQGIAAARIEVERSRQRQGSFFDPS